MSGVGNGRAVKRVSAVLMSILVLVAPIRAFGGAEADVYAPRIVALLPPYCKYAPGYSGRVPGGDDPVQVEHWKSVLGYMYYHIHHYCWGLAQTEYALLFAHDAGERTFNLSASLGNFDYVLRHMKPDYVLLPEVLTRKGENLIRLGRAPEAMEPLERAIAAKPDYWPPYAALADYFKDAGEPAKAREWLRKGLEAAPKAEPLQRRLAALGSHDGAEARRSK